MRDWIFSSVTSGVQAAEGVRQHAVVCLHDAGDRQQHRLDADVLAQFHGIVDAALARINRGHHDAEDIFRPHGIGRNGGGERRIDAAGESQEDFLETGLTRVIADAQHQRVPDLGFGREIVVRDASRCRCSEIHDEHVFVEAFGAREQPAVRIEGGAAAVEDQVVVGAHLVDDEQRQAGTFCAMWPSISLAQHLLADVKRRCREVEDRLRACFGQGLDRVLMVAPPLPEIAVVPDVFADADAEPHAVQFEHLRLGAGSKYRSSSNTS